MKQYPAPVKPQQEQEQVDQDQQLAVEQVRVMRQEQELVVEQEQELVVERAQERVERVLAAEQEPAVEPEPVGGLGQQILS
jgi:hypothetical protein